MFRSRPKEPVTARCWLIPGLEPRDFFLKLRRENVQYCVLRWFESLPEVAAGEDLDILVSDESLPSLLENTSRVYPDGQKMDVYSESGALATDWAGIPYFPKQLSSFVLANTVEGPAGALVPNPRAHFLSLAYHAVFHKGFGSGLPATQNDRPETQNLDHDYRATLLRLRDSLGWVEPEINLEGLADFLEEKGFFPNPDVLEFLATKNQFLSQILARALEEEPEADSGLSVFIVRESGLSHVDRVRQQLELSGFEILKDISLTSKQAGVVASSSRGGNWTRGPYPRNGGQPGHLFVTADVFPLTNKSIGSGRYPCSTNLRVPKTKQKIRDLINSQTNFLGHSNAIHSSDNSLSTSFLVSKLFGREESDALYDSVRDAFSEVKAGYRGMEESLGNSRRAVISLEQDPILGTKLVRKTFRRQHLRFLAREIAAREKLSTDTGVLKISEVGPNYFSTEFLDNCRPPEVLTPGQIRKTREFLKACAAMGIAPIDFSPANILVTQSGVLRFLDFEFFQDTAPGRALSSSVALRGLGPTSPFERPDSYGRPRSHYRHKWFPYVFLPRFIFVMELPDGAVLVLQRLFRRLSMVHGRLTDFGRLVDGLVRIKRYFQSKILYLQRRGLSKLGLL